MTSHLTRRNFLTGSSLIAGATVLGNPRGESRAQATGPQKAPKFLFVLGASGGASLLDGPLAIRASESPNAATINAYADAQVTSPQGSPLRAVSYSSSKVGPIPYPVAANQSDFITRRGKDMLVVTQTGTSVNHLVGQRRSVTGNEAWAGRSLQEVVAAEYGAGTLLPNVHLVTGSEFTARGTDGAIPLSARGEVVPDALLFPLGLHGYRGIAGGDRGDLIQKARALRDGKLQPASKFSRVFEDTPAITRFRALRGAQGALESADLVSKLMIVADGADYPLGKYGLASSPSADKVRARFPDYAKDPLEAQAALAYLLVTQGVSVTVTLGANSNFVYTGDNAYGSGSLQAGAVKNLPIAFDYAHTSHRSAQAFMWQRMYKIADGLIDLLVNTEYAGGTSYWDHSAIYIATEFGRTKTRPANADEFSTGHDLNNGVVILSPMARGNTVLGGVDPATALTYGFDLQTGAPDKGRTTAEKEVFAGLLGILGVDTSGSGLPDVRAMRRV